MSTPLQRIAKFLDERAKMRGLDPAQIASLNIGHETREAVLNTADLRSLIAQTECFDVQTWWAKNNGSLIISGAWNNTEWDDLPNHAQNDIRALFQEKST